MEDGAFKPNITMLGSLADNAMDFSPMHELLLDGFWLETTDDSNFWQPGLSTSLDNRPLYSNTSEINIGDFNSNLNQASISEEGEHSNLTESRSPIHTQMDQIAARQSQNQEAIHNSVSPNQTQNFLVEGTEKNRRLWIAPNRNLTPNASLRNKLVQAIEYLKESTRDKDVLIQIWVPINRGGKNVLTTNNQPFSLNPNHKSLAKYRHVSKNYQFALEEDSKDFVGLPGRVFLKKLPEWTPDVRFFKREEYPRINHAQQYNIGGSLALPVFEHGSGTCLGVVEIISTSQIVSYQPELETVRKALEAVDLKSSDMFIPPEVKDCSESYQVALAEIKDVLQCVCDMHKLPLAQTWARCSQQGKGGCRHSDETYAHCVSTIGSACYVRDPQVWDFHVACSEHHLLEGEGVAGGAFTTNQPCFATDVTAFSKTEYPLSHHAKMFHLSAAVAIRLRCIYTGSADFVLEFFLPLDCRDAEDQKQMLNSLSSAIQQICRSLRVVTDHELIEETASATVKRSISLVDRFDTEDSPALTSPSKKSSEDASSWIAMASMADKGKGKGIAFSLDNHRKEPEEEFKLTTYWDKCALELHQVPTISDHNQIQQSHGHKENASGSDYSVIREHHYSGTRRAGKRRRTKTEKTISLQVLRQYFAGSLKDAAKSIGVCPTTLKRICRQHGITRWPSRKIKKVGHSLRKLQLVIDSVQGAEGSIQLSSFYNNFPELSSTSLASPSQFPTSNPSDDSKKFSFPPESSNLSPATTLSKSPTSSGSHSSSSSFCCSVGATKSAFPVNLSSGEHCIGTLKKTRSDAELQNMVQEGTKLLVRSRSHKTFIEDASLEALPPLAKASNQIVQDGSTFRVKATFGEEKIRFSIQRSWAFEDLLQEVRRRFSIDDTTRIDIKYLDDDSEWVLLTCDADLEECIDIHKSSRSRIIKLSLHQPYHLHLPNSFGSRGLS